MGASRREYHLAATNLAMASHVLDLENINSINSYETVKNDLSKSVYYESTFAVVHAIHNVLLFFSIYQGGGLNSKGQNRKAVKVALYFCFFEAGCHLASAFFSRKLLLSNWDKDLSHVNYLLLSNNRFQITWRICMFGRSMYIAVLFLRDHYDRISRKPKGCVKRLLLWTKTYAHVSMCVPSVLFVGGFVGFLSILPATRFFMEFAQLLCVLGAQLATLHPLVSGSRESKKFD